VAFGQNRNPKAAALVLTKVTKGRLVGLLKVSSDMAKHHAAGERYAHIPVEVLEHVSCATLPHAAFKVLVMVAAGYNGHNNGTQACTESWMRKFGITGTDTARRSLKLLVERGLIEITRPGMKMRKIPTLYAVTWRCVDNRDGWPIEKPAPPSHKYAKWDGGYEWNVERRKWVRKISHPCKKGSITPIKGVESEMFAPIGGIRTPSYTPTIGDTLRSGLASSDLGGEPAADLSSALSKAPPHG
jgi:hypothetical protein